MGLSKEKMYEAIIRKDSSFEGIFFTAVKTTGVFCKPSCPARKPKFENVDFFFSSKECLQRGFRPCKVCKPLEAVKATPTHIQSLLREIEEQPHIKINDQGLRVRGLEPNSVRRWFQKNHGLTFQGYQRMIRINHAFKLIKGGESIIQSAFEIGFESLSGFNEAFKNTTGINPSNSKHKEIIDLKRFETPLGTMVACSTKKGICLLEFTDRRMLETEFKQLIRIYNAVIVPGTNALIEQLEQEVSEYFKGKRTSFSVGLDARGSSFQEKVWEALQMIPYGTVSTYKKQSELLEKREAVRAVANANGMNRISILIPCHRVIGSDGTLAGYGGGIWRKQYLLDLEKKFSGHKT
jgi:AraC family transcriptional regulator of adaptative response/methylated-DNA-[protein]-cysteine methyltransferase